MPQRDNYIRKATLLRVVDADTLVCRIDLGYAATTTEVVRLYGVDTPEARGPEKAAGDWVTKQVTDWIGDARGMVVHSHQFRSDSWKRVIATCWVGGRNLNAWLLEKGYAWPTDDSGHLVGDRSIESLAIPEGIKQSVREAMS